MKRRVLTCLWCALLASEPVSAQLTYVAFEQITVGSSAVGLTTSKITPAGLTPATNALCRLETAEIRYTVDGTTVTSSVGTPLEPGDILTLTGHDTLARFQAIETGATSGQLDCTYWAGGQR